MSALDDVITCESGKQYMITKRFLGGGAFGSVWLGKDHQKKSYAIKKITIREEIVNEIDFLLNEISILKKLNCYPGVVCIYDSVYNDFNKVIYIVMELVDGESFDKGIKPTENLLKKCVEILNYIHKLGIIHRDIKPENIMVIGGGGGGEDDNVKFVDFGTGCAVTPLHSILMCEKISGTQHYLDPLFYNQKISVACRISDIYSLGATFYTMMTRETPPIYFGASDDERITLYHSALSELENTKYSPKLKKIVGIMINPEDYRPSTKEILTYLSTGKLSINGYDNNEICRRNVVEETKNAHNFKDLKELVINHAKTLKDEDEMFENPLLSDNEYIVESITSLKKQKIIRSITSSEESELLSLKF
jgi:serine/threonine protein kinase